MRFWKKKKYSMYELKCCRDYHDGKLTKKMCDQCSTCDMAAAADDGFDGRKSPSAAES
jgi:hypothetical protein